MKLRALISALALPLIVTSNVYALSVGEMTVNSNLGEPLALSIDVSTDSKSELDSLKVRLAPRAAFEQSGVPYPVDADAIEFSVDATSGKSAILNVSTPNAVDTPYVHLLMQVSWSGGKVLREYVALIDPAGYGESAKTATAKTVTLSEVGTESESVVDVEPVKQSGNVITVKSGDTLSSIAQVHRPADISMQQAWVAFYNLNKGAFTSNNIDLLERGAKLTIPTRDQMLALSQVAAISEVKVLSPSSVKSTRTELVASAGEPQVGASGSSSAAEQGQVSSRNALTIGAPALDSGLTDHTGISSAAVEQMLEGKFGEMASIRQNLDQFSEEMVAVRSENKVVADRLSKVESQLSKISQLLDMQSQTLAALNEQARLQLQSIAQAQVEAANMKRLELEQLNEISNLESSDEQSVKGAAEVTEPLSGHDATENSNVGASSSTEVSQENTDAGAQPTKQLFKIGLTKTDTTKSVTDKVIQVAQAQEPNAQDDLQALSTGQQSDTSAAASDAADANEAERKSRIEKVKAALREQIAESRRKKNLESEPGAGGERTFLNTDDWTGSVVSAKNKIVDSLKDKTEQLSEDSSFAVLLNFLKKWGLYISVGILGLIGLGSFMRRRSELEHNDDQSFESFDDDIKADIDRALAGEESSSLDLFSGHTEGSSVLAMSDESLMQDDIPSESIDGNSSLFAVDDHDSMMQSMDSEIVPMSQQSNIRQSVDVDPLAEAEVYLAYDRKEQAIKVLKEAYEANPKNENVAIKLLSVYQGIDDADSFNRVLDTAFANRDEEAEESQWPKIKAIGRSYSPTHSLFLDNEFDSSIPILRDEVEAELAKEKLTTLAKNGADESDQSSQRSDSQIDERLEIVDDGEKVAVEDASQAKVETTHEGSSDSDEVDDESVMDSDSFSIDMDSELDETVKGVNQHDPDTSLALAKAYIELGERNIAKDFLSDVIETGNSKIKIEAQDLLKGLS